MVFEPFVTAGKENGLGLGLALSRRAVLDHGGDMWIEAAAGARFVIRFPLKREVKVSGILLTRSIGPRAETSGSRRSRAHQRRVALRI